MHEIGVLTEKNSVLCARSTKNTGASSIFLLIGALAMFLYGMKAMSDGLQRMARRKTSEIYLHLCQSFLRLVDRDGHHRADSVLFGYDSHDGLCECRYSPQAQLQVSSWCPLFILAALDE